MPQVDDSAQAQTGDVFARAGQGPGVGVGCNKMAHAALRQQSGDYTAARSYIESQCGGRQWGLRQQVQVLAPIRRVHAVMNMYGLRQTRHCHAFLAPFVRADNALQCPQRKQKGFAGYVQRRLAGRSEEHTSELQSLMRISYAVFCLTKKQDNTDSK